MVITKDARGRPSRVSIYQAVDEGVAELRRIGGLPGPEAAADIWRGIWFEETHNATAIEGNTLILKEVQALLAEGRAVGDKELKEYLEVKGYADAAEWVYCAGRPYRSERASSPPPVCRGPRDPPSRGRAWPGTSRRRRTSFPARVPGASASTTSSRFRAG